MVVKKTELYSALWESCDQLRGGMDASQYKDYILTLLFVKYVSDKYASDPHGIIVIPEGGSFVDVVKLKGDKEIGDKINTIIGKLAKANDLNGVINIADFNDEDKLGRGQDMVDRLSKLVAIFEGLDLGANRAEGDDLLGDAYEYLMRHFATESGKSKGQFYTPAEVSRIMAKVVGIGPNTRQDQTVYDPTCGSGSLLLKAADEAPNGLSIYGQEMDSATRALARMNMILHDNPTAEIWRGNTLADPHWLEENGSLKMYDYAVANPPFSYKSWSNGLKPEEDAYERFEYGVPPAKNGDYAFLLHLLKSLKSTGKGAIVMPHGVLFRGNVEADIRRTLIRQGVIKGIIGLPANLFYGTGIPACVIVLDKELAHSRTGIFMIDASRGFIKDGNKNRLRERDIHKIVDVFTKQTVIPGYSRMVTFNDIEIEEYNLNIPRYIDSSEPEDIHDLDAHLNGGIPQRDIDKLENYWQIFPSLRQNLFAPGEREGYSQIIVETNKIKSTILNHPEFVDFSEQAVAVFREWWGAHEPALMRLSNGTTPKALIHTLSEDLLARYTNTPLVDEYAIYQLLMDYWADTMQDDVYLIKEEGWTGANRVRVIEKDKDGKYKEEHDFIIKKVRYKADLIPPDLIITRYLKAEKQALAQIEAEAEKLQHEIDQMIDERSGEDDILQDIQENGNKVKSSDVKERILEYEMIALHRFAPELAKSIAKNDKELTETEERFAVFLEKNDKYFENIKGKNNKPTKGNANQRIRVLTDKERNFSENTELKALNLYIEQYDAISLQKSRLKALMEQKQNTINALILDSSDSPEISELTDLKNFLVLLDDISQREKEVKAAQAALDEAILDQYPKFDESAIKDVVIIEKWKAKNRSDIKLEIEQLTQKLAKRIKELEERYAEPLPQISAEVEKLSLKVEEHLRKMGVSW